MAYLACFYDQIPTIDPKLAYLGVHLGVHLGPPKIGVLEGSEPGLARAGQGWPGLARAKPIPPCICWERALGWAQPEPGLARTDQEAQGGPQKWAKKGPKMAQKWPKKGPKWVQNGLFSMLL